MATATRAPTSDEISDELLVSAFYLGLAPLAERQALRSTHRRVWKGAQLMFRFLELTAERWQHAEQILDRDLLSRRQAGIGDRLAHAEHCRAPAAERPLYADGAAGRVRSPASAGGARGGTPPFGCVAGQCVRARLDRLCELRFGTAGVGLDLGQRAVVLQRDAAAPAEGHACVPVLHTGRSSPHPH
eukprot:3387461-Prymnesium_polylepis.1